MTITETTAPKAPAHKQAASLVPQIIKAHEQLVEIESEGFTNALNKGIELGVLLNLAQEAVYRGHFWEWFAEHNFAFSDRMARRYMRLAREREKLESALADRPRVASLAGEGQLSIRAAEALLADDDDDSDSDKSDDSESKDDSSGSESGSEKSDAQRLADLIRNMPLIDVVTAVVEAFDESSAQRVAEGITKRLEKDEAA
jgi:hypothetical protein